jgi:hypothetical protein
MSLSRAIYGFITGDYDLPTLHHMWKEEIYTPTLDYYFNSVKINGYLYSSIKHRRRQVGLL